MVSAVWGWTEGRRTVGVRNQGVSAGMEVVGVERTQRCERDLTVRISGLG